MRRRLFASFAVACLALLAAACQASAQAPVIPVLGAAPTAPAPILGAPPQSMPAPIVAPPQLPVIPILGAADDRSWALGDAEKTDKKPADKKDKKAADKSDPPSPFTALVDLENRDMKDSGDKKNGDAKTITRPRTLLEWKLFMKDGDDKEEDESQKRLPNDRPHFADDPTTVGLGRFQIESGYLYTRDRFNGVRFESHAFPDTVLRLGIFAEWFELRLGWNYAYERFSGPFGRVSFSGADDMMIGFRLALTEQSCWLPESALTLELRLPTGASAFTSNEVLPSLFYHYGWDVVKDFITVEGYIAGSREVDDVGHPYLQIANAFNIEWRVTRNLTYFTEYYGTYPMSALSPNFTPQHYFHTGLSYYITNNFEVDWHIGFGLNRHSEDMFTGAGFAIRF